MTDASSIAKALGGKAMLDGYLCKCPVTGHGQGHGDRNPSLFIKGGRERLLVKCFTGCSPADVIAALRGRGLLENNRSANSQTCKPTAPPPSPDREQNLVFAHRMWGEAVPLPGTLGETYFTGHRHLPIAELGDLSHALRWHAGKRCVVGLMTDPVTSEPLGVHRTFLNADGSKSDRKMLGPQGVVRLSRDEDVTMGLGIAEASRTG